MNRREFQIGPGAASLLLIAVVLCMGVLGALSLVSARGDARLSERAMRLAESTAQLNSSSERKLAELDAVLASLSGAASDEEYIRQVADQLPQGTMLSKRTVTWLESAEDGKRISCGAEIAPLGELPRVRWVEHRVWMELDEPDPEDSLLFSDPGSLFGNEIPAGDAPSDALEIDLT